MAAIVELIMNPFERLVRRQERWLLLFALALALGGFGLVVMLLGLFTGLALPVYSGLVLAASAAAVCAGVVQIARKKYDTARNPATWMSLKRYN